MRHKLILSSFIFYLFSAAPAAMAANECGAQSGTDPIECPAGTYNSGITYSSIANLTLNTEGAVDAAATGIDLTGNGSNSVTLDTTAGAVSGSGGINITSGTGPVTVNAGNVIGGIVVESQNGAATVNSTSGDIDVHRARPFNLSGSTSGNILATGTGNITLFHEGAGSVTIDSSAGSGLTHITHSNTRRQTSAMGTLDATVGSGGLIFDITGVGPEGAGGSSNSFGSSTVNGVIAQGAGTAEINVWRDEFIDDRRGLPDLATLRGAMDFSGLAGGVSFNIGDGGAWEVNAENNVLAGAGDTVTIETGGVLYTDLSSITTDINTGFNFDLEDFSPRSVDFGDGEGVFANHGQILVGPRAQGVNPFRGFTGQGGGLLGSHDNNKAELRLENLSRFDNHGDIHLGVGILTEGIFASSVVDPGDPWSVFVFPEREINGTDRSPDDMLSLEGAAFVGHEGSRIFMDIDIEKDRMVQDRCTLDVRLDDGSLPANDCINLRGGSTSGNTGLVLTDVNFSRRGVYNPEGNVLVDVTGGDSAQGHFTVDPASDFYSPVLGGSYDRGIFIYTIVYDEDIQQHKLVGLPSGAAWHQPMIANAATATWRTASGSFFDRQADLRDTLRGGDTGEHGVWIRVAHEAAERDVRSPSGVGVTFNNDHDVDTDSVTLGVDFLRAGNDDRHGLLGAMIGYARTDLHFGEWTNSAFMNGVSLGFYGSWIDGPLFVDAMLNGIFARLDQRIPQAQFFDNRALSTDVDSLGAQVEAGWRFDFGAARIEPLLNLSHINTSVDEDMKAPEGDPLGDGNLIAFDGDTTSTRIGGGLRSSTEFTLQNDLRLGLSLTGRVMNELDGESRATIINNGEVNPQVVDEFDGTFSEVVGGVTVTNSTGRVSGVLNVGSKFGDDYDALSASASFRYQW